MTLELNRTLQLPVSEYFPEPQPKTGIAIHHTVGLSAKSAFDGWRRDKARDGCASHVATAYLIGKEGTAWELFDPAAWAWQFGLDWPDEKRIAFEKRFIGIELVSAGGLTERSNQLYACEWLPRPIEIPRKYAFDAGAEYRGFRWFDSFEEKQLATLGALVDALCTRFSIPRVYPAPPFDYYGEALARFEGVIGHAMVRADKSDPAPDLKVWQALAQHAALRPVAVAAPPALGQLDRTALFAENLRVISAMDTAAGSVIKNLLMELERRGTCLRLHTPAPGSTSLPYEVALGDPETVARVARALGLADVTDRMLEVRHA